MLWSFFVIVFLAFVALCCYIPFIPSGALLSLSNIIDVTAAQNKKAKRKRKKKVDGNANFQK